MPKMFFSEGEERALDVFRRAMQKEPYGTEIYRKAERDYAFFARKIIQRVKLDKEYGREHRTNS